MAAELVDVRENRKETADPSAFARDDKGEGEGSIKSGCSTGGVMGLGPTQGDEKCLGPATTLYGTGALSFVIPSEAEGSAVPRTFRGNVFLERSGEIRGFSHTPYKD